MNKGFTTRTALIVALGGFLMGFDASVISGVVGFIEQEFALTKLQLGWSVASLSLAATLAMLAAGPLSDRFGRKPVLSTAAILFAISAIASALATSFPLLVTARIIGGLGVGMALIIAPMYIAEISPAAERGRMVSFNQLNIVIGISVAFFSNYLILKLGQSEADWALALRLADWNWRWMLGLETLPAVLYFFCLFLVPESPRWLIMHDRSAEAVEIMSQVSGPQQARVEMDSIMASLAHEQAAEAGKDGWAALFSKPLRLVLMIGLTVAVLQQITGINSVFFYAPMIFEQSGIGTDAAFMQAILVGLTNLAFTILAMALIDRVGRKPLLVFGVTGIALCMLLLAASFNAATYTLTQDSIAALPAAIDRVQLQALQDITFNSDVSFGMALSESLGSASFREFESSLVNAAININPMLVLFGILGFVACFAISIGPVMWVLFSELFPNRVRAIAISFVGLVNSAVSFTVQLLFPWQLANLGSATTFLIYGVFAVIGLVLILKLLPETRGKSLEELEKQLVSA
ncbi:MAG: sugar porter family MFS transporter [Halieaceae bacterium]